MKNSDEEYFREVDVQYRKKLYELHNFLPFLPEGMKIEKVEKLLTNLFDENEYVIPITNLKQALIHGLVWKKKKKIAQFYEKLWKI